MANHPWTAQGADQQIREDLMSFLPEQIFDSHAHIWRRDDLHRKGEEKPSIFFTEDKETSIAVWRHSVQTLLGKSVRGGLFFAAPVPSNELDKGNRFIADQLEHEPVSRGLMLVSPDSPEDRVEDDLRNDRWVGFKPYSSYGSKTAAAASSILDIIPERYWRLADRQGLVIMFPVAQGAAMAEPDNLRQLREWCGRFPGVKCVLPLAADVFHTASVLRSLRGPDNIYFHMTAVCESEPIVSVLDEFGPRKLLWGSGFPISTIRGKLVRAGMGSFWMQDGSMDWDQASQGGRPALVGLESLRALRQASDTIGLNRSDMEHIFHTNGMRLTGQLKEGGDRTESLYRIAKSKIPGGTQLLSKRPELMAPNKWPAYFSEARGCEIWDLDGKHYYDMSTNGIGACLLGYRDEDVTRAVRRRLHFGSMSTLNPPEEVELADTLCELHPWASQVRFTRAGGEACTAAVRIARATTGRSIVAVCGYHGWHDWYIAANLGENDALTGHLLPGLEPSGVPRELRGTTVTFRFNDRQALDEVIRQYGSRLAAVIMEPCRHEDPEDGFLSYVRDKVRQCGALLIFDEITIGWRLHRGGAHLRFGINPDIAVFAKALGNGHPIAAVIGTDGAMDGAHRSFVSSTYWTESIGPVAALATLQKMSNTDVPGFVAQVGGKIADAWTMYAKQCGVPVKVPDGYRCLAKFEFVHEHADRLKTLYTVNMLRRGFLAGTTIYPTMAHSPAIVAKYTQAIGEVFEDVAAALNRGDSEWLNTVEPAQMGFRRLN